MSHKYQRDSNDYYSTKYMQPRELFIYIKYLISYDQGSLDNRYVRDFLKRNQLSILRPKIITLHGRKSLSFERVLKEIQADLDFFDNLPNEKHTNETLEELWAKTIRGKGYNIRCSINRRRNRTWEEEEIRIIHKIIDTHRYLISLAKNGRNTTTARPSYFGSKKEK